jgi:4-hydroxybenzoate polyprenyltransferase
MPFLLTVSRPRFWFYLFGPYIVGLIAGVSDRGSLLDWRYLAFGLYFLLPANVLVYGINDIFDYETDILNPKKADYESLVTPESRRRLLYWIMGLNLPFIVLAAGILDVRSFTIMQTFIFLSIFYSSPPIRAKSKPFLDSAFNVLYAMPGIFGYCVAAGAMPPTRIIVAAGLWTAAMHAYSAVPDIDADREAGLNTVATFLGGNFTIALCLALYVGAAILSANDLGIVSLGLGAAYALLMLASFVSFRNGRLMQLYSRFPLINIIAGTIIFWQIALDKLL